MRALGSSPGCQARWQTCYTQVIFAEPQIKLKCTFRPIFFSLHVKGYTISMSTDLVANAVKGWLEVQNKKTPILTVSQLGERRLVSQVTNAYLYGQLFPDAFQIFGSI